MFKVSASLLFLTRLRAGAKIRQMLRSLRTVRGALLYGFGLVMFSLAFLPGLISLAMGRYSGSLDFVAKLGPEVPATGVSALMLLYCILVLLKPGKTAPIPFDLAEVDFLFAGPFRRSELLVHKLGTFLLRIVPTAAIMALFSIMASMHLLAVFLGVFLSFAFGLLFPTLVVMASQAISVRLYTWGRRLAALGLTLLAAVTLWHALSGVMAELAAAESLIAAARAIAEFPALRWLLLPFAPFGRTITAPRLFPDFFLWGGLAAGIDLALVAAIVRLDAEYFEVSLDVSRKMHENMKRLREGGFSAAFVGNSKPRRPRWSLPDLPHLGGAGVLAWRQLTTAFRGASRISLFLGLVCLPFGILAFLVMSGNEWLWGGMLGGVSAIYMPVFLRYDFRGDLNKMDWMKALPLNPMAVTIGQLLAPVLVATAFQAVVIGGCAALSGYVSPLLIVCLFAPLVNALVFSVENAFFLLFPTRMAMMAPGDFAAMGRMYLMLLLRGVVYLFCLGALGLAGGPVYLITDSWFAIGLIVWLTLAVEVAAAVFLTARAFKHFDLSADVPA